MINKLSSFSVRVCRLAILPMVVATLVLGDGAAPRAQTAGTVNPDDILYILPTLNGISPGGTIAGDVADFRARIGEGPYVKVGLSFYIEVVMNDWNVNPTDRAALRANLAGTISEIDYRIAEARSGGYPVGLYLMNAIRRAYDPVQRASEQEDRRNMQWYSDNALAPGWWTHSRYARKQQRIQEAYARELASVLADRMARYPETLVNVSGDGEVELSLDRADASDPALTVYADYSPFTIAEFRDWIRAGGLYAAGQPFAGQSYANAARYAGDATPGTDTNGDGHTLNGDFGTSFTTWDLRQFDWSLSDSETQRAIPLAAPFDPGAVSNAGGFDAPRTRGNKPADYFAQPAVDYWKLWLMFRSEMLQRHNIEFAKWMTTSASVDSGTAGYTMPKTRFSSYQIPGDYLFNGSPQYPNSRYESSASAWTTADVSPYGSAGYTSFNINISGTTLCGGCSFPYFLTLKGLAPAIGSRNLRFSLLEWHPAVAAGPEYPPTESQFLYDTDRELLKQYRPTVLSPFILNDTSGVYPIKNSGTETMLRQLVTELKDGLPADPRLTIDGASSGGSVTQPFTLTGAAYDLGKVRGSGRDTGMDSVAIRATPIGGGAAVTLTGAAYGSHRSEVANASGSQFGPSGWSQVVNNLPPGTYDFAVSGHSTHSGLTVTGPSVRITVGAAGAATSFTVDRSSLAFGGVHNGTSFTSMTAAQQILLTNVGGSSNWTATSNQPWVQLSPASGFGTKVITVTINPATAPSGSSSATITFAAADGAAASKTVSVTFTVTSSQAPPNGPSGSFDTPTEGSTVSGSIALTGWALDNIEVVKVELFRDAHSGDPAAAKFGGTDARAGKVFIGNAAFVEGARTDIENLAPTVPRSYRAGWGYLMLTRGLIWEGQGPFKLWAFAFDIEGNMTALGSKTITINNAASIKPFGAIDTPGQGETVGGTINNFGWVIPSKGSTISQAQVQVFIDDVFVGNPGGMSPRADLDAAFKPDGFDTSQANRVLSIDTTRFANGVHTIVWVVTDSSGQADGIGSRYIKIQNGASLTTQTTSAAAAKQR